MGATAVIVTPEPEPTAAAPQVDLTTLALAVGALTAEMADVKKRLPVVETVAETATDIAVSAESTAYKAQAEIATMEATAAAIAATETPPVSESQTTAATSEVTDLTPDLPTMKKDQPSPLPVADTSVTGAAARGVKDGGGLMGWLFK